MPFTILREMMQRISRRNDLAGFYTSFLFFYYLLDLSGETEKTFAFTMSRYMFEL